jgi:hypothetical protein
MTDGVVYLSIYQGEKMTVTIEYIPLDDGLIEIVSVDIQERLVSPFQIREQERQRLPKQEQKRWKQLQQMDLF